MLKKRIIPLQTLMNGRLVKTRAFENWRDVGDPVKSSAVYNSQYADELIFLDITRGDKTTDRIKAILADVSRVCFMPLAAGGGISTWEQAADLILNGADKVVVNTAAYRNPKIITEVASRFGAQSAVVSIDAKFDSGTGTYRLVSNCGMREEYVTLADHVRTVIEAGAGELLIQSIDNDGMMGGFDMRLIKEAAKSSTIPLIVAGGSGNYSHLHEALAVPDVSAVACGSLFNFSDSNPMRAKAYLSNYGLPFKVV